MASVGSSTTLALKAAFVAAMLAVLVLPSMGRCPSLGPEVAPTPAPTPVILCSDCDEWAAPTPARTPVILCSVCDKRCFDVCYANVKVMCNENCNVRFYGCSGCWNLYMPKCDNPCKSDCRAAACVSK